MLSPRVLVAHKLSKLEELSSKRSAETRKLLRRGGAAARALRASDAVHGEAMEHVLATLRRIGLTFEAGPARQMRPAGKKYGLILSVGGDGTFLDAARIAGEIPILGVNSDPHRSVGRFCPTHSGSFGRLLRKYLQGVIKPTRLVRLRAMIEGSQRGGDALNDILVTTSSPALTSDYILQVPGAAPERQRSSGMWIATAAGSTAAIRSAGGKVMPLRSRRLQYLVREPYLGPTGRGRIRLRRGYLGPNAVLTIESRMAEGRIYIDGGREKTLSLRRGEVLEVSVSPRRCFAIGLA